MIRYIIPILEGGGGVIMVSMTAMTKHNQIHNTNTGGEVGGDRYDVNDRDDKT